MRPVVYLMVGLPCSGKTTYARALADATGAVRLTPDEWHARLFGSDAADPDHDRRHDTVEEIMWDLAGVLVARGVDVILDFGFWTAGERERVARRVKAFGAEPSWHYLDVEPGVLRQRVAARNADPSYTMKIPDGCMEAWTAVFQPPTAGERLEGPLHAMPPDGTPAR